ncbi:MULTISPECIES: MBL fold metallo-hydrolase [unclassified Sedimentibacter]|uniref:MBL fold metallo-hydrolase n=1 Tax=unclassified Sedimentibacter TaxID=2649220 RepID=UPI0027E06BAD|nr:MBL fold metallo-hydrolase [Sedimentibacter sp. MB35-C1]WMJ77814.1 MBL fold metallo-hydrolase [Sedimentibacter sp. MB35-C1]
MKLKFCSLYSGSSGNCQYIKTDNATILVDAGLSGKKIQQEIVNIGEDPKKVDAIFITHEHVDHIKGAGIMSRRLNVPIYANQETWDAMKSCLGEIKPENIKILERQTEIKDLVITPFDISHDAAHPVGYNIFHGNKKISLVTDTGCINDIIVSSITDSDLLLVESNHDEDMVLIGPYPWPLKRRVLGEFGHMSNDTAGDLITKVVKRGTEIILLGHLSKENNFPQLAYKTVENILKENSIEVNPGICLDMTYRDRSSRIYEI